MEKYNRINIYYKKEDEQDSLRYSFLESLGNGKKKLFDSMIDQYLQSYGISNLEDLTLKDLREIKKELIGSKNGTENELKEKRGRGRPRKIVEQTKTEPSNEEKMLEKDSTLPSLPQEENTKLQEVKTNVTEIPTRKSEEKKELKLEQKQEAIIPKEPEKEVQVVPKTQSPMAISVDEDTEDNSETEGIDVDLLGELDAFF